MRVGVEVSRRVLLDEVLQRAAEVGEEAGASERVSSLLSRRVSLGWMGTNR